MEKWSNYFSLNLYLLIFLMPANLFSQQWNLILYEEFDGPGSKPNSDLWKYDYGWNTIQDENRMGWECVQENNIVMSNGTLKLYLKYEPGDKIVYAFPSCSPCYTGWSCYPGFGQVVKCYDPSWSSPGDCFCEVNVFSHFSSGAISSKNEFGPYGRFEMKAKMPGNYVWPAFWLREANQELDLIDNVAGTNDMVMNVIGQSDVDERHRSCNVGDQSSGWHYYTLEWTPYEIIFLFDGAILWACSQTNSAYACKTLLSPTINTKMKLIADVKFYSWLITDGGHYINEYTTLNEYMEIDYIKVWSFNGPSTVSACTTPNSGNYFLDVMSSEFVHYIAGNFSGTKEIHAKYGVVTIPDPPYGGSTVITSGSNINFTAGNYIVLTNFHTENNMTFSAKIIDCASAEAYSIACAGMVQQKKPGDTIYVNENGVTQQQEQTFSAAVKNDYVFRADSLRKINSGKVIPVMIIFPNPSNGIFEIGITHNPNRSKISNPFVLTIKNVLGELVYQSVLLPYYQTTTVDLSGIPHGLYFVKVVTEDEVFVQKIVLQ